MTLYPEKHKYPIILTRVIYESEAKARQLRARGIKHSKSIYSLYLSESKLENYFSRSKSQIKTLIPHRIMEKFTYHVINHKEMDMGRFSKILKRTLCKRLINLEFFLANACVVSDDDLKIICTTLKQSYNLRHLNLLLYSLQCIDGSGLAGLKPTFKSLKQLKRLDLQFAICDRINDYGKACLLDAFHGLKRNSVESLYLNVGRIYSDLNLFLPSFAKAMCELKTIKSLKLNLLSNDIEEPNFLESCLYFSQMHRLLTFGLSTLRPLCDTERNALVQTIAKMQNLKCLYLKLKKLQNMELLFSALSTLSLEELHLYFCEDETLYHKEVTRTGYEERQEDNSMLGFSEFLKMRSAGLKKLTLQIFVCSNLSALSSTSLSSRGLIFLSDSLLNCTCLEHLHLYMAKQFSQESLSSLLVAIRQIKGLKTLFLFVGGHEEVTEDLISQLAKAIADNPKLESLVLFLRNMKKIGDQEVINLAEAIAKLENLEKLVIDFENCSKLKKTSVHYFVELLKQSKRVKRAKLAFVPFGVQNFSQVKTFSFEGKGKKVTVSDKTLFNTLSKVCSFDRL